MKNFSRKRAIGTAAFLLCTVLFISSLVGGALIYNSAGRLNYGGGIDDLLLYDSYADSIAFQREFDNRLSNVLYLLDQYKSEDYIKSGKTLDAQRLNSAVQSMDSDAPVSADEARQTMIMDDLRSFKNLQSELNQPKGFTYFATDGTWTVTNSSAVSGASGAAVDIGSFERAPAYLIYKNDDLSKKPASPESTGSAAGRFDRSLEENLDSHYNPKLTVCFSFDQSFLNEKEAEFSAAKAEVFKWVPMTVVCGVLALILFLYLVISADGKDKAENRPVRRVDRIFTELQLLIVGVLLVGGGAMFGMFLLEAVNRGVYYNGGLYAVSGSSYLSAGLAILIGLFSAGLGLYFILSVVRNIKAGRFLKNSAIFMIISALWGGVKDFYRGGSVMKKIVLITLAVCILSATVVLTPVIAALILVFAPKWVKKYEAVKTGVEEVKNGNLTYKIPVTGDGELDELARGINAISEASNLAIQNELKNQRLKTDLISNVSHDLKTPLTSIITYIDLLKQEGLDSPDAPKYLEILDQKSIRLKKLTDDLFDAAKASSGAIPVSFERVDMLSLINQGLGEMNDRIEASNLEFRISAQKEKYYVRADGQLLWRVVENLLGNVLKYAQEGSRVYIDLKEQNGRNGTFPNVILEIKNISRTELNIDADELMERFKRGDESRTTEGSGLGLAIAKDLVRLQNGWFEIKIDGDLFKAVVMLEAYRADAGNEAGEE